MFMILCVQSNKIMILYEWTVYLRVLTLKHSKNKANLLLYWGYLFIY